MVGFHVSHQSGQTWAHGDPQRSGHAMEPRWLAALVVTAVLLGGCSPAYWVAIVSATATDPAATSLTINIDGCANVPEPRVVESDNEVHLLIDLKLDGDMKACLSGVIVHLAQPIGARKVIDDRRHLVIPITWSPISAP